VGSPPRVKPRNGSCRVERKTVEKTKTKSVPQRNGELKGQRRTSKNFDTSGTVSKEAGGGHRKRPSKFATGAGEKHCQGVTRSSLGKRPINPGKGATLTLIDRRRSRKEGDKKGEQRTRKTVANIPGEFVLLEGGAGSDCQRPKRNPSEEKKSSALLDGCGRNAWCQSENQGERRGAASGVEKAQIRLAKRGIRRGKKMKNRSNRAGPTQRSWNAERKMPNQRTPKKKYN